MLWLQRGSGLNEAEKESSFPRNEKYAHFLGRRSFLAHGLGVQEQYSKTTLRASEQTTVTGMTLQDTEQGQPTNLYSNC